MDRRCINGVSVASRRCHILWHVVVPLVPASHPAHAVPFYDLSFHLFLLPLCILFIHFILFLPYAAAAWFYLCGCIICPQRCLSLPCITSCTFIPSVLDGRGTSMERSSGPGQSCSTGTELYLSKGVDVELSVLFNHLRPLVIFFLPP